MRFGSDKTKISLRLFDGDLNRLRKFYPNTPYNEVVRKLVHHHLNGLDRKLDQRTPKLPDAGEKS